MRAMKYVSRSIKETAEIVGKLLEKEMAKERGGALILGLYGDLGAGKTAFVKESAWLLGVKEIVVSPTFVILKRYKIKDLKYKNLIHIDAYRLESEKDLEQLGWNEIIKNPENIIFIEWPERVGDVLPKDAVKIYFEFVDEETRGIKVPSMRNES